MLCNFLDATLSCVAEMQSYSLHLLSAPANAASLLVDAYEGHDVNALHCKVLLDMKQEWSLVLAMERHKELSRLLQAHCPYVRYQCYREIMSTAEKGNFKLTTELKDVIGAWFPRLTQSANVEDVFNSLQDAVKRSTRTDCGSMANLSAVAVRSCYNKLSDGEGQGFSVRLEDSDFEGSLVRGLKARIFSPESCHGRALPGCSLGQS